MVIDELRKLKNNFETTYYCCYGVHAEEDELSYFEIQNSINTEQALLDIIKFIKILMYTLGENKIPYDQLGLNLELGILVNINQCDENGLIKSNLSSFNDYLQDIIVINWYNWSFTNEGNEITRTIEDIKNYKPSTYYVNFNKFKLLLNQEGLDIDVDSYQEIKNNIIKDQKTVGKVSVIFNQEKKHTK